MAADIQGLAVLHYGPSHYEVIRSGHFVLCAVSGERIALDDLTYWSAEFQEAYRGPHDAIRAWARHLEPDSQ